jgi:hypothetical protein
MPDLERCITYKGRMYCWNRATQKIAVVDIKDLDFKDCPERVIQTIIADREEAGNGKRQRNRSN